MVLSISVALCTRNGAQFIEEQLHSIFRQVPPPIEIVLSDDASNDDTVVIARRVAEGFFGTTLRVVENSHPRGVVANFEQATLACTGDLIALSDQDDVWHEGRLLRLAQEFATKPELLLLASDAILIDADGAALGSRLLETLEVSPSELAGVQHGDAFAMLLRRNLMTGATMVFRRSLLKQAVPFPPSWVHDEWLASVAAATGTVDLLAEPLVDYRQHAANQIGARRRSFFSKVSLLLQPREDRNSRLVARASDLVDRLESMPASVEGVHLEGAKGKLAHERARQALPSARFARLRPVFMEARTKGYAKYGRGLIDILRDLLQPAR